MKYIHKVLLLLLCFLLFCSSVLPVGADFGNYSDYGGSDWSGSSNWSSSDWGGSSNWGSSDWDFFDSGSNSLSSSSGSFNLPWGVIIFLIIVFIVISKSIKKARSGNSQPQRRPNSIPFTKNLPDKTQLITEQIQIRDPAFSPDDFLSFTKYVFIQIQDAWSKQDLTPVAGILHQNLYQMTDMQIQQKKAAGMINRLERISVNTAYLTEFFCDDRFEYLTVYICAQMIDYQENLSTGQVVLGNKSTRFTNHYRMKFQRTVGTKTINTGDTYDLSLHCPGCGAPVNGTAFGVCEYCGATVTNNLYTWVLADVSPIK